MRLRGGGSAVPGRVALAIDPGFLSNAVAGLPLGVIFVSGSNGKSTTTHFVTKILRAHGLTVFTNSSGGNLPQGIASSMLPDVGPDGRLKADIAVLEVDEAFGPQLIPHLHPRGVLLLNVQVDQLNRFFDPARVAGFLATIADACGDFVVLNADDDSLRGLATGVRAPIGWFGVDAALIDASPNGLSNVEDLSGGAPLVPVDDRTVEVVALVDGGARLRIGSEVHDFRLPARGLHYAIDAAGAVATAVQILGVDFRANTARDALAVTETVFGRGELLRNGDEEIEIVMMKNPPSLQMNLDALDEVPEQVLVAVDEGTPDPSWMYGIDLSRLDHADVVTGTKAWQVATVLEYAGIDVRAVEPSTGAALDQFLALPRPSRGRKLMIVNYEQMMNIRRRLGAPGIEGKVNS
ncbi:DUF1727 domain-containing protein [Pseudoclavibacter chungangensis]|uniref:DUF1727 domain-containing protein n=2 Tax=Pseudoclavibacter chungangensis TaxID=587635 RepID=A0A7J5BQF2_9MICO|nr:MurT ligase domain-containing protein [Pseudoclavibacter chungangensis]KAB1656038.1 DUF1727 domain-containing protein [Pseudoclavibacter chungangensis]